MPGMKVSTSFPGMNKLPTPIRSLMESVFPQEPALPGPAGLGMAAAGKVIPGAIQGLQRAFQSPVRQPKPGGTLYKVLEQAGLKSGMGDTLTPGESSLVQQFKTWGGR